jgi:hypothetical protein
MKKYDLTRKAIGLERHPQVIVKEYENKYILEVQREKEALEISEITFEGNNDFCDLIDYLKTILRFKENELEILYEE